MMKILLRILLFTITLYACQSKKEAALFDIHYGPTMGINFQNTIITNDSLNALDFEYIYNGGGIGIGDFNNDGFEDIFFGGNQVSSELYLNKGELKFQKITVESGVSTTQWVTGVSVVDINQDGLLDIYLSVGGYTTAEHRENILFVNQGIENGIPRFQEMAEAFGLNDDRYSTMAAFFDYDKDGDLDMYLVNNWLERFNRNNLRPKRMKGEAQSTDRLYRNNGNNTFTDVSHEAGILIEGYGLGINICDINQDSWPDVYVSNDFMSNDILWINNGDGTFTNKIGSYIKHQTHNGMGVDVADFNNDQLADIIVVDMLPPGHNRQKMMTSGQNYDNFHQSIQLGYEPQYMRNTLQLNRGNLGDERLLFSEISFMAGVAQTDWSWAPLFADFDNDGMKDLFIANGYRKDVTNLDFIFFGTHKDNPFGTPAARKKITDNEFKKIPDVKISNYIFKNNGTLVFEDKTEDWGITLPTFSNGAVYADLDNDGDLDLITNNIDQEVIFYENKTNPKNHHFISLVNLDTGLYNQKVWVYANNQVQYQELSPYRGFQSSVTQRLHFGVGETLYIDSIKIVWNDHMEKSFYHLKVDSTLAFTKKGAVQKSLTPDIQQGQVKFTAVNLIDFSHKETSPSDIKITRTLLHELTRSGPCFTKGDVNNDKLDDFFIGGENGLPARIFIQKQDGSFASKILTTDSIREDGGALFFDADNDGDLDLYVASSSPSSMEEAAQHILYLNDGSGNFAASDYIPLIKSSSACVIAADYDNDGDLDLFIGGRIEPKAYPLSPRSYVLQNTNGVFTDVTSNLHPDLESPGMVTSALWVDLNNDKLVDLVIAGEWMPIRVFLNRRSKFIEETKSFGLADSHGWWNCLQAADLNNDGYLDIVAGNTGKNSFFKPTKENPVMINAKDFDGNGSIDPIISYYNPVEKERFIVHNRLVLIDQIPGIKRRFETFGQYASTPANEAFTNPELKDVFVGTVNTLTSIMLINQKGKSFNQKELPESAQFSTVNGIILKDLNNDSQIDLITIGNMYAQETLFGRYDASIGEVFLGDGNLNWKSLSLKQTNFVADGDAKAIDLLNTATSKILVVVNNNGKLQTYTIGK